MDPTSEASAGSSYGDNRGALGDGWFIYQDMCISDCRETALEVLFYDEEAGGRWTSILDDGSFGGSADFMDKYDVIGARNLATHPEEVYNFNNECKARCSHEVDDDTDAIRFAPPDTKTCVYFCPTLHVGDALHETDYYAQVGSRTCDTIDQCKRRDKAGSAAFGNEFVTVYHDHYGIEDYYLDHNERNDQWTAWFDMGDEAAARNPNDYSHADISEWFAYTGFKYYNDDRKD